MTIFRQNDTVLMADTPDLSASLRRTFIGREATVVEGVTACIRVRYDPTEGLERGRTLWLPDTLFVSKTDLERKARIKAARELLEDEGYVIS